MGEWTNLKMNDGVEFRTNLIGTTVTISTIYGEYTVKVDDLKRKANDHDLLPDVRKMFQAMLDYYEQQ